MKQSMETRSFLVFLLIVTVLFGLVLEPFWGAIFWAAAVSVIFYPLQQRLVRRFNGRRNLAAITTLLCCMLIVVIPVLLILAQVVREAISVYQGIQDGEMSPGAYLDQIRTAFPIIPETLERLGIDTNNLREQISSFSVSASRYLAQETLTFGQNTLTFVLHLGMMLYLTFFLLRDGNTLTDLMVKALPLGDDRERRLFNKFAEVTRATVKGNLVVAMVQGALGGFIFWILGIPAAILWGVMMMVLSLIPAVGAALVWAPAAIYLFAVGDVVPGIILVLYGVIIIGLADNILRPILVGRDTKLPDYLVLFSTLGGIALMGINGFVIGPLIAAVFLTFWDIFMEEFNSDEVQPEVTEPGSQSASSQRR